MKYKCVLFVFANLNKQNDVDDTSKHFKSKSIKCSKLNWKEIIGIDHNIG